MQKARSHPTVKRPYQAPTACRPTVSGTFHSPHRGSFSPFPHGTSSLSVIGEYLALEGGPPRFPQGSTCPVVLGCMTQEDKHFSLTGLSPSLVTCSKVFQLSGCFVTSRASCRSLRSCPATPCEQRRQAWHSQGLGCSPFARHYLGNLF